MKLFSKTDIGLVRQSNQDACAGELLSDDKAWAVVCDGMGGAAGGNIASRVAVEQISASVTPNAILQAESSEQVKSFMVQAVNQANEAVYHMAKEQQDLRGMGTTIVLAVVMDEQVTVVHAGDSRAYLLGADGAIRQLTVDHSMVQELVSKGDLTEQQAQQHPQKNIITRALGVQPEIEVDSIEEPFLRGERLLICTDGLSNYVTPLQISQLSLQLDAERFCDQLIALANQAGGGDNITVVVIEN